MRAILPLARPNSPICCKYEYSRSALREGLRHEANLGANPFKFGLIGSTDSHTGMATTYEDNFFGKFAHDEPSVDRTEKRMADQLQKDLAAGVLWPGRGLGGRKHPRVPVSGDQAPGGLCHLWHSHSAALLWRLGV